MKRFYTKESMAGGIRAMVQVQNKARAQNPAAFGGPIKKLDDYEKANTPQAAAGEQQELREGHCLNCGEKKTFTVEGEQKMKNGAIRKHGKAVCGHTVSHFVKGTEASGA